MSIVDWAKNVVASVLGDPDRYTWRNDVLRRQDQRVKRCLAALRSRSENKREDVGEDWQAITDPPVQIKALADRLSAGGYIRGSTTKKADTFIRGVDDAEAAFDAAVGLKDVRKRLEGTALGEVDDVEGVTSLLESYREYLMAVDACLVVADLPRDENRRSVAHDVLKAIDKYDRFIDADESYARQSLTGLQRTVTDVVAGLSLLDDIAVARPSGEAVNPPDFLERTVVHASTDEDSRSVDEVKSHLQDQRVKTVLEQLREALNE